MLYLLYGGNEVARNEAIRQLKQTIPEDLHDLNMTVIDGRSLRMQDLMLACEAIPFLSERRLVLVEDAIKGMRSQRERDALKGYLPKVPVTTDLVFVEGNEWDKRSAIFGVIKKSGEVREFAPLEGAELLRWVHDRSQSLDARITGDAAQLLVEFAGNESRALLSELQKLACYVGPGGTIDGSAVRILVADASERSVFTFVDALAARKLGPALRLLRALLGDGQAPTYLLFMIGRQIRLLIAVNDLSRQRHRPEDMASRLGQKPFVIRKAVDQARLFPPDLLLQLHDRLLELDHWSKTGRISGEAALELLVAESCH